MADRVLDGGFCVIRRPKLGGVGFHFGVLFTDGKVADLDGKRGVRLARLEEFAFRHRVEIVRRVDRSLEHESRRRALHAQERARRYHVLDWNCETFANWVTGAKPMSREAGAWTAIVVVAAVLVAAGP